MFLRNLIIFSLCLSASALKAETLKSLAQKSALILALADEPKLQKKCQLSVEKISALSQKLKAAVDQKITVLTEQDFQILNDRAKNCHADCTCTIYSLAFEVRNKKNDVLNEKASKETASDRLNCISKIKNICLMAKSI